MIYGGAIVGSKKRQELTDMEFDENMKGYISRLRMIATDAKEKSLEQHDKERHGGHYDGGPCSWREKHGIPLTKKGEGGGQGGGNGNAEPQKVEPPKNAEPPKSEPEKKDTPPKGGDGDNGGKGFGDDWRKLFHQTKARKQYDELKRQFDEAKEKKDIEGMSAAMDGIDKLLTDPSNEGTQWKDEEWTPRDKSGDKVSEDGTIMKNGVALDKTFQDGGTESKYRLARNKWVKQLLSAEDGTFDLETGKPVSYDKGFQVAFQTTASEKDGGMSDEEYDKIVDDIVKETGAKPDLGCFEVPEISFHFDDRKTALAMMEKYNQHSIWNWGKFRIIMNKNLDTSTNDVKQGAIANGEEGK